MYPEEPGLVVVPIPVCNYCVCHAFTPAEVDSCFVPWGIFRAPKHPEISILVCPALALCHTQWHFTQFRKNLPHEHPLVAPQVSHFSQVPLRTMVKFWHSEHMLPV